MPRSRQKSNSASKVSLDVYTCVCRFIRLTVEFLRAVAKLFAPEMHVILKFSRDTEQALFLFDESIADYLTVLFRKAIRLHAVNAMREGGHLSPENFSELVKEGSNWPCGSLTSTTCSVRGLPLFFSLAITTFPEKNRGQEFAFCLALNSADFVSPAAPKYCSAEGPSEKWWSSFSLKIRSRLALIIKLNPSCSSVSWFSPSLKVSVISTVEEAVGNSISVSYTIPYFI